MPTLFAHILSYPDHLLNLSICDFLTCSIFGFFRPYRCSRMSIYPLLSILLKCHNFERLIFSSLGLRLKRDCRSIQVWGYCCEKLIQYDDSKDSNIFVERLLFDQHVEIYFIGSSLLPLKKN